MAAFSVLCCLFSSFLVGCNDRDYPLGLDEYAHHYYIVHVPNNNSVVQVNKNKSDLLELPLQFYSEFERNYDAVATYTISITDLKETEEPAILGEDFQIVDADGQVLQAKDGLYEITFPKAKKSTAAIYVKLLNNPNASGTRFVNINLVDNIQDQYRVDIFSTAFKRTLQIN